jgi:hypothetical protein
MPPPAALAILAKASSISPCLNALPSRYEYEGILPAPKAATVGMKDKAIKQTRRMRRVEVVGILGRCMRWECALWAYKGVIFMYAVIAPRYEGIREAMQLFGSESSSPTLRIVCMEATST